MKGTSKYKNTSIVPISLTYAEVLQQIKSLLPTPVDLEDDHHLIELGLDSLQMMRLVNQWRKDGAKVTFAELIASPRLGDWWSLLQQSDVSSISNGSTVQVREEDEGVKELTVLDLETDKPFPLTDVQYAYWIGRRQDQPLGGVGCHAYLEMDGKGIEPERLEAAWMQLLRHHSMLRAKFLADGTQEIMDEPYTKSLVVHDLRLCSDDELEKKLGEIREQLSHRCLAVEKGEVAGLELSLLPGGHSRLHFDIDMLVADVQSLYLILRDLTAAYAKGIRPAAPPEWNFANYLKEETARREASKAEAAQYWNKRLPTLPGAPELPLKERSETIKKPEFKRRQYFLESRHWALLQKRAAKHHVTPAMVLLTAYADILDRWSTNSQFLINIPLFNRQTGQPGLEDVVADFTNLLLLAVDCRSEQSFLARVNNIQTQFHQDVTHADYSGVQLQRDLARVRHGEREFAPVVFACNLGTPLISDECRKTLGELSYMISQTPQVWLDFQIYEMDEGLLLAWDSVDQLFHEGVIDEMFKAFTELMEWLVDESYDWGSPLKIVPDSVQQRLVQNVELIQTKSSECLHTAFFEWAVKKPESTALIDTDSHVTFSYGELSAYALRVAALLKERGVQEGDPVAVILPRGVDQIAAILGVLASGGCYVPISIDQPAIRKNKILQKANIRFVLTDEQRIDVEDWPAEIALLRMDEAAQMESLIEPIEISSNHLAYIIFTSGSTGEPKGVEIRHGGAWNTIADINERYCVGEADRMIAVSSFDFDLSVYDIFGLFSVGGFIVVISEEMRRDAKVWLHLMERYQITMWNTVPILLDMLLITAESQQKKLISLRLALLSGDWIGLDLPPRLKEVAEQCHLVALGGATEASIWSNYFDVSLPLPDDWTSIPYGRPLSNQLYRIVDDKGRDCPDFVAGELWIGGDGVAKGYCGEPELTADHFVNWNGTCWYRTGDLGRYWTDGNIEFLGRQDFQVKIRGHRIELGEIEMILKEHPAVRDTVITVVNSNGRKRFAGYIVLNQDNDGRLDIENGDWNRTDLPSIWERLSDYLGHSLPEYMIPSVFIPLKELPLTANGKIDRNALPAIETGKGQSIKTYSVPRTSTERLLAQIWGGILDVERVYLTDNFFECGGDSLLATKLIALVRNDFQVELSLGNIFEGPTVKEIAERIQELVNEKESGDHSVVNLPKIMSDPEHRYTPFPLTDIQHAYWVGRSGAYSLGDVATHCYFEIEGMDLDVERINGAWQRLIDHHEMMRAVILPDGQQQKILQHVPPYQIEVMNLRGLDDGAVDVKLNAIREQMSHQVLSTDTWPLFDVRASLFGTRHVRLHISFDNILFDGYSMFRLLNEWARLYHEPKSPLPAVEVSFRDYVLALERLKESSAYQRDLEYWLQRLHDLPPAPDLPLAQKPESLTEQRFSRLETKLNRQTWRELKKVTAEAGVTPSGILLAAFTEILALWSRRSTFTINLTQFNRLPLHPQVNDSHGDSRSRTMDGTLGDFTSVTLLAVDHASGKTFFERARNLQEQLWRDMDHPYVGGVQVQRELAKKSGGHQSASMPVVFTSTLGVDEGDSNKKWLGKLVYNITQTPQVWLDHQVVEQDGELFLSWDAVKDLFPEGLLEDMFAAYCDLLQRLVDEEMVWMQETPCLVFVPRLEKRIEANNTNAPISLETLTSLCTKQRILQPDHPAVITSKFSLTYEELLRRSEAVACCLQDHTLVGVIMEKGWEQVVAVLGILKSGAAYLPIDPAYPEERREQLMRDGQINTVLTQSWLGEEVNWPEGIEQLFVEQLPLERKGKVPLHNFEGHPEDLAYVIYTSGSTGTPKGVMNNHQGAVNTILDVNQRFSVGPKDRILSLSNLNFDLSVYDIFGLLGAGGTIIMPDPDKIKDPAHWLELLKREQITVWNTVPALMQLLLEYVSKRGETLPPSIRLVLLSGDWIPLELPDKIKAHDNGVEVIGLGGATEASIWSNWYPIREVDSDWSSIPYGRPLTNQRYYVLNEFMADCPVWVRGQLYIGGLGVAQGYWQDNEKTQERFIDHPYTGERLYRTGDVGRYLPDGNIEFLGREDSQVKIRGHRIELGEIETVLHRHDDVKDAVVAVSGEGSSEQSLVGYVVADHRIGSELFETKRVDPDLCLSRWQAISDIGRLQAVRISGTIDFEAAASFLDYADQLSIRVMCQTFYNMGIFTEEGERYSFEQLLYRLNIHGRYNTLIHHWLDVLCNEDLLEKSEAGAYYNRRSFAPEVLADLIRRARNKVPPKLADKALDLEVFLQPDDPMYIRLLRGEVEPIQLLVDEASVLTPEGFSRFDLAQEFYTNLACKVFDALMNALATNKGVQVLEIGSRAGGLIGELAPLMPGGQNRYVYADESSYFTERARRRWGAEAPIEYSLFDMNKPPSQQGYEQHSFDVIVAHNTLHRARNIEQ
ncbi:non-ribosomal peptide synthetase, partial [Paenibacillus sp.]|uniref:non-ribosomal peptide synthetase n=1 Tax=Paenibacillus sp. TaxID=58172 RepID=UPI002830184A